MSVDADGENFTPKDEIIDAEANDADPCDAVDYTAALATADLRTQRNLILHEGSDGPTFAEWMNRWEAFKQAVRELDRRCKDEAIAYLKRHGPQQVGDIKYFAGQKKQTACTDRAKALDALMMACDGDINQVAQHLSAGAIKAGAARKTLDPVVFNALFETKTVDTMEKTIVAVNTKFLPNRP